MSTPHELPGGAERDNVVPLRPGTAVEPKVFDAEIVPDDTANTSATAGTALERRQDHRRDLVVAVRSSGEVTWRFTRRHWAILCKGMEAERQRKRSERHQGDVRTARKVALEKGDLERVSDLNRQITEGRRSRVEALTVWVELAWSVTCKATVALGVTTGTALVVGIANGIGGWFGPWGVTDVLHTIGDIINTGAAIVSWTVGHAWLFGLAGLGVWL
ncbi:ATP-binding protein, partial [Kibdelosporangium lantanae]